MTMLLDSLMKPFFILLNFDTTTTYEKAKISEKKLTKNPILVLKFTK